MKKAEQELWQALETLDIKEIARKEKKKQAVARKAKASKTKKITEFFMRSGEREEPPNKMKTLPPSITAPM